MINIEVAQMLLWFSSKSYSMLRGEHLGHEEEVVELANVCGTRGYMDISCC